MLCGMVRSPVDVPTIFFIKKNLESRSFHYFIVHLFITYLSKFISIMSTVKGKRKFLQGMNPSDDLTPSSPTIRSGKQKLLVSQPPKQQRHANSTSEDAGQEKAALKERLYVYFQKTKMLNEIAKQFFLKVEEQTLKLADNPTMDEQKLQECARAIDAYVRVHTRIQRLLTECYRPSIGTKLLLFGDGDSSQLGQLRGTSEMNADEATTEAKRPRELSCLNDTPMIQVACAGLHTLLLRNDGRVLSWGCNDDGALGRATPTSEDKNVTYTPDFIPDIVANSHKMGVVLKVSCGDCQSLALTVSGTVYLWGCYKSKEGTQFRDLPEQQKPFQSNDDRVWKNAVNGKHDFPVAIAGFRGKRITDIRSGVSFNAAIDQEGILYTWGLGECGELGRPSYEIPSNKDNISFQAIAQKMLTPMSPHWSDGKSHKVESIACGGYHLLATTLPGYHFSDVRLFTTGLNNYGQLGLNDDKNRAVLTEVQKLNGYNIDRIGGGLHHSLCTDERGNLIAFGRGDSGQLGITSHLPAPSYYEPSPVFVELPNKDDAQVTQISCGGNHNVILTLKGSVYTWGFGTQYQLGHGVEQDEYRPRKISLGAKSATNDVHILQVAGGGQHSAILCTMKNSP